MSEDISHQRKAKLSGRAIVRCIKSLRLTQSCNAGNLPVVVVVVVVDKHIVDWLWMGLGIYVWYKRLILKVLIQSAKQVPTQPKFK